MGRLAGKHVLVTAAGWGIGRACAAAFHSEGATVFATDIDPRGLSYLEELGVSTMTLDGTDPSAVERQLSQFQQLDSVVHCIGRVDEGTVLQCDAESWRNAFRTNVDSFYYVLKAVLPKMLAAKAGSITCISSVASSVKGLPNRAAYGATKAALIGLIKSVAADYVGAGIRCNAVCPGTVISPSLQRRIDSLAAEIGAEQAMARYVDRQPMSRLGTPEEVASLCLYLASDESRFVTGQVLAIDGGITI
jgi:2-keto-3-deoxy-L-fuconate dehydrogenase